MVPAYTLPANLEQMVVMRVVARQEFSMDMAEMLLSDIQSAISEFEKLEYPTPTRLAQERNQEVKGKIYTHTSRPRAKAAAK